MSENGAPMTDLDALIKEGRELLGKATPGQWNGISAEESNNGYGYGNCLIITHDYAGCFTDDDQTFIAFARNNLARFLDEIEQLRELKPSSSPAIPAEPSSNPEPL